MSFCCAVDYALDVDIRVSEIQGLLTVIVDKLDEYREQDDKKGDTGRAWFGYEWKRTINPLFDVVIRLLDELGQEAEKVERTAEVETVELKN